MKFKIVILAAALVLVAAACNKAASTASTSSSQSTNPGPVLTGTTEIDRTSSGFSPSEITVKSGTVVVFKNMDTKPSWPASNPHPTHTDLPGFDALRGLATGETYSFTFTKVGIWGFHDHLAPSIGGHITVVQ